MTYYLGCGDYWPKNAMLCAYDCSDSDQCTALHAAVTNNNLSCAQQLLTTAGNEIVDITDDTGGTALHVCARYCNAFLHLLMFVLAKVTLRV